MQTLHRRVARTTLALLLAVGTVGATGACGDRNDGGAVGPTPVIAGRWSGTAKAGLVQFRATFTSAGDSVGGTGYFSSPLASDDFTIAGTRTGADVRFVLTSDQVGTGVFTGKFTGRDRIEGRLDLPDDDLQLVLDRD